MKGIIVCLIGGVVLAGGLGAMTRAPQEAPPSPPPVASAAPSALPDGVGREMTQRVCGQCHSVGLFATQRHSQDEWNQVISRMMAKGMSAPEDDLYEVSDYLAENLGKAETAAAGVDQASSLMTP